MTGEQRHTDHIDNGQRVSRHSLPTHCFLFFPHPHFLKTILSQPASGTFGLAPTHIANPSQSQKSHFFAFAQTKCINLKCEISKPTINSIIKLV